MYEELLKKIGLTTNETKVYLALLCGGKQTTGTIIKLADKGLIKTVKENNVKQFLPNNPETLLNYLADKEKEIHKEQTAIQQLLPTLKNLIHQEKNPEDVSYIKGIEGLQPVIYHLLTTAKRLRFMGARSDKAERYNTFWKTWHQERVKRKLKAQVIFSDKNTSYWKFFKQLSYTETREILSFSPAVIMIIDEHVFILSYEGELTCIHIISTAIATSFNNFFDSLWNYAQQKS